MTKSSRARFFEASRDVIPQVVRGYPGAWGTTGELKSIDVDLSSTDVSTTEQVVCLNPCTQGSDIGNRVGREILMRSVQIRGVFNTMAASVGDVAFWALVYDRQTNAAAPAWTDVYTTDDWYPNLRNLNNRKRFKILGSGYISLPKVGADNPYVPFEFYRKLKHPVEFNATNGGTVADITTGGLFWLVRATVVAAGDDSQFRGSSRVRFADN